MRTCDDGAFVISASVSRVLSWTLFSHSKNSMNSAEFMSSLQQFSVEIDDVVPRVDLPKASHDFLRRLVKESAFPGTDVWCRSEQCSKTCLDGLELAELVTQWNFKWQISLKGLQSLTMSFRLHSPSNLLALSALTYPDCSMMHGGGFLQTRKGVII